MEENLFQEYIKESEPNKRNKGYAWSTAIGLQATDQLKPSKYLLDTAIQNIEGKITLNEAENLIDSYYKESPLHKDGERTEEADKVSVRIAKILSENAFSFSPNEYLSIHRKLFLGIYSHAGKIRDYNITKKEWVLDGATVVYGSASELRATLEYDFSQERNFSYKGLSMDEIIHHLAVFVSNLWQIHIFGEGNTRTTAVFFIKYLRKLGFSATNDIFAEHAWYFRNALVRANYTNLQKGIHETTEYLELFLRNLLLNERNELRSRNLHIRAQVIPSLKEADTSTTDIQGETEGIQNGKVDIQSEKVDIQSEKVDIRDRKVDIQGEKVDIQDGKVDVRGEKVDIQDRKVDTQAEIIDIKYNEADIRSIFVQKGVKITNKTVGHITVMYQKFGCSGIFGRSEVASLLGLQNSSASKFIAKLLEAGIIEYVSGHGKGKYRFI